MHFVNMSFYIIFSTLVNPRLDFHPFYEYKLVKDEEVFNLYPDYQKRLVDFIFTYKPVIIYSRQNETNNITVQELIFSREKNIMKYKAEVIYQDEISKDYLGILLPEN